METGDLIIATSADGYYSRTYSVEAYVQNTIYSTIYEVENHGQNAGTITGVVYGTTVNDFLQGVTAPDSVTLQVYSSYDLTTPRTGPLAEDDVLVADVGDEGMDRVYSIALDFLDRVYSSEFNVNEEEQMIYGVEPGTSATDFKAGLTSEQGVTFELFEADGTTVKTGVVEDGDCLIVTGLDGVTKTYWIYIDVEMEEEIEELQ